METIKCNKCQQEAFPTENTYAIKLMGQVKIMVEYACSCGHQWRQPEDIQINKFNS